MWKFFWNKCKAVKLVNYEGEESRKKTKSYMCPGMEKKLPTGEHKGDLQHVPAVISPKFQGKDILIPS